MKNHDDIFETILKSLPQEENEDTVFWSDGKDIVCIFKEHAFCLKNFFQAVGVSTQVVGSGCNWWHVALC